MVESSEMGIKRADAVLPLRPSHTVAALEVDQNQLEIERVCSRFRAGSIQAIISALKPYANERGITVAETQEANSASLACDKELMCSGRVVRLYTRGRDSSESAASASSNK